ncbi:MAG: alpha/beta fold hydrolase [Roseiflexaceae bacterium]|nr:alpha/beta fold hydrolase [Roseiflexaceae bacterium]
MTIPALPGITVQTVETPRIRICVRSSGPVDGTPVIFVHGNVSSGVFWEETMLALPATYRAIAPDLRGYGDTEALQIDATRGLRDWSDDLRALIETLGLGRVHLVGWSLGGGIVMQYAIDHPADVASITLSAPMSPYGFGATKDPAGTPTNPDFAGSGGGAANPEFVQRLAQGDRGTDSPNSPRNVMIAFYFRAAPEREAGSTIHFRHCYFTELQYHQPAHPRRRRTLSLAQDCHSLNLRCSSQTGAEDLCARCAEPLQA